MLFFLSTQGRPKQLISWAKNYKVELPSKPEEIENVTRLDLSNKGLVKLPKEIDCLKNLTEFYCQGNELTELPWEFGHLKKLKTINLSHNRLIDVPGVICQLSSIENLKIGSNFIKKLSPVIANLTNLVNLDLSFNNISDLPQEISHLSHLVNLDISANNLSSLPASFTKLYNLAELKLWKNKMTEIPELLKEMPNLKSIIFETNQELINQNLILAALANNTERASKLILLGADVNYKWPNFHHHSFSTALFASKTIEMVELLLNNGADINMKREIIKPGAKENAEPEYETFLTKKQPAELAKYLKTLNLS